MCKSVNDVIKGWLRTTRKLTDEAEVEAAFKQLVDTKRVSFEAWG